MRYWNRVTELMMATHEVTDEEIPLFIEFLTKHFYPLSVLVSSY